jgi:ArsR family transcriptional regulator
MPSTEFDAEALEAKARDVAAVLRALANERRLMILCKLVEWGEASAGTLAEAAGLSQPALSQHLALMRAEGLVAFRRESQTLWYRIADPRIEQLFGVLHALYCAPQVAAADPVLKRGVPHVSSHHRPDRS